MNYNLPIKYVTINLGGGLGNILFQISAAYTYAKNTNRKLYINYSSLGNIAHSTCDYLFLTKFNKFIESNECNEPKVIFNEHPLLFSKYIQLNPYVEMNVELNGYFQHELYFNQYFNELKKIYNFSYDGSKYNGLNKCFIHVRRGDFLNIYYHYIDLTNYFLKAIKYVTNVNTDCTFYIFSNDIEYCKKCNLFNDLNKFTFVDDLNELESIKLMSMCQYGGICSNSSYSWWGAYLNESPNKLMICPNKWCNDTETLKHVDIYPKGSVIIDI